jgi:predicted Zn-dependent protease
MDLQKIKAVLAATDGVHGWLLRRVETDSMTVIRLPWIVTVDGDRFVRHPNPRPREVIRVPSEEVWVTVYSRHQLDGAEMMGEASGQLLSDDPSVVRAVVTDLLGAARRQSNVPFSLPDAALAYPRVDLVDPGIHAATPEARLARVQEFAEAVLTAAEGEPAVSVSNLETFAHRIVTEFETSTGLALTFPSTRVDAEVCLIARLDDGRVAEHTARPTARRMVDLDAAGLVHRYAGYARGMATAGAPPSWSGPVVLLGDAVAQVLGLNAGPFPFHAGARAVHEGMSRYAEGKPVHGDTPLRGDALTLASDPLIAFGARSQPFSIVDGSPSRPVVLVRDGCWDDLLGTLRYYDYLGLTARGRQPSGASGNTVIPAGAHASAALLDEGRVVVVRALSDFRAEAASGDFACEVRLGAVRELGRETPFKGGLLIGNYFAALADIRLSCETTVMDDYHGPAVVRFGALTVAG